MVIAYRVEHPSDKNGVCRSSRLAKKEGKKTIYECVKLNKLSYRWNFSKNTMNTPSQEGYSLKRLEKCAFNSVQDMLYWIREDEIRILIKDYGYKVYELELSRAIKRQHQTFYREKHIVKTNDITNQFL